jgi:hypothetical protein
MVLVAVPGKHHAGEEKLHVSLSRKRGKWTYVQRAGAAIASYRRATSGESRTNALAVAMAKAAVRVALRAGGKKGSGGRIMGRIGARFDVLVLPASLGRITRKLVHKRPLSARTEEDEK